MNWNFLVGPIVGGIIGYITNGIAIKMLFRPLKPIYIGGKRLPFTPGIIPKEKARIARNVGEVISKELINEEVLKKALLKEEIYSAIRSEVAKAFEKGIASDKSLGDLGELAVGNEKLVDLSVKLEEKVSEIIYTKVVNLNIGEMAVSKLTSAFKNGMGSSILGSLAMFINASVIESIGYKIEPLINNMVEEQGKELIRQAVHDEGNNLLEKPVSEVVNLLEDYRELITEQVLKIYEQFVQNELSRVLETLNIAQIVEDRINAFDTLELERIILDIMAKELRAIVSLGALLGAIMGCIMNFV